jgi:hypothetical protein
MKDVTQWLNDVIKVQTKNTKINPSLLTLTKNNINIKESIDKNISGGLCI